MKAVAYLAIQVYWIACNIIPQSDCSIVSRDHDLNMEYDYFFSAQRGWPTRLIHENYIVQRAHRQENHVAAANMNSNLDLRPF